ncbi:fumarylacetoacetate hydrolase family protein [Sphingopyxis sp. PET50]|uniref:fumarylacetoacetate hydrolase family protein n=1 Tax=Sphingopyxis sp. PET50 TaxID=2976533 RepID=UPI0021B015E5|nr:fumarylacetoacetate hydrolase family protein [Sphingopyxis sp. PET50]
MRLITYEWQGKERLGAWIDNDHQVVDLAHTAGIAHADTAPFASMLALIEGGSESWDQARVLIADPPPAALYATADVRLLAPLPRPTQIRDCLCFPDHLRGAAAAQAGRIIAASVDPDATRAEIEASGMLEVPAAYFDFPVYYISNRMAVVGPDADVEWPPYSQNIDYEMEWAAVIGTPCRGVDAKAAGAHIFGYTVFNDWSARDEQMRAMRASGANLGPARGKDFCNGLGPCIVTADEIADPYALAMTVRINGEQVSRGSSSTMHYKFEDLIAFLSAGTTLYPGEILGSGTVGGGCAFETGQIIRPGDVIELDVESIGTLRNRVVAPHIA